MQQLRFLGHREGLSSPNKHQTFLRLQRLWKADGALTAEGSGVGRPGSEGSGEAAMLHAKTSKNSAIVQACRCSHR